MDETVANDPGNKEPAEGSRENVNLEGGDQPLGRPDDPVGGNNPMERGPGQLSDQPVKRQDTSRRPEAGKDGADADDAGGITNQPLSREKEEEGQLPPRGETTRRR